MANPRSGVSRNAVNPVRMTFIADATTLPYTPGTGVGTPFNHGTAKYGYAVAALSSDTVGFPATTTVATIVGAVVGIEKDQRCTVWTGPNIVVPYYNGAITNTINIGDRCVVDEYGLAKTDTSVKAKAVVVSKDTVAKTVELLMG